jgi:hypothetical protein
MTDNSRTVNETKYKDSIPVIEAQKASESNTSTPPEHKDIQNLPGPQLSENLVKYTIEIINGKTVIKRSS